MFLTTFLHSECPDGQVILSPVQLCSQFLTVTYHTSEGQMGQWWPITMEVRPHV